MFHLQEWCQFQIIIYLIIKSLILVLMNIYLPQSHQTTYPNQLYPSNPQNSLTSPSQKLQTSPTNISISSLSRKQLKQLQDRYQLKILQLQNQLKYSKQEMQYNRQLNKRQRQQMRILIQHEWTCKLNKHKNENQAELSNKVNENTYLKQHITQLQSQIANLKSRYQRSQKYNKQIEIMFNSIIKKQENIWKQQKIYIIQNYQSIIQKIKNNDQTHGENRQQIKRQEEKQQDLMINKIKQLNLKINERLTSEIKKNDDLNHKLNVLLSQIQNVKTQKNNIIKQYTQKINILTKQQFIKIQQTQNDKQPKIPSLAKLRLSQNKKKPQSNKSSIQKQKLLQQINIKYLSNVKSYQLYQPKSLQSTMSFKPILKKSIKTNNKQNFISIN